MVEVKTQRVRLVASNRCFDGRGELTHSFDIFFAESVYARDSLVIFLGHTQSALDSRFPFCTP